MPPPVELPLDMAGEVAGIDVGVIILATEFFKAADCGDPEYPPVRISFSGAILYCEATNLWTAFSSSRKIFMRMKGSRPFWVSMCHGLGLASRSETEP